MQLRRPLSAAIVVLAVLLAACGGGDGGTEAGTTAPAPATEATEATEATGTSAADAPSFTLTLGTDLPLTGSLSTFGPPLTSAVELAVDQANQAAQSAGMSDVSVELAATEDSQTQQGPGVEAATKLVQTDQVDVLIGAMASNVTIPIAQSVTIPNGVVQITPTSTSPALTDLEDDGLVYRILASDVLQGEALADAAIDAFGSDATLNVGARNDAFGTALLELFVERWTSAGGSVGQQLTWNPDAANFDSEAQQLTQGDPDGWVIIDFPETFERMAPSLVRTGSWDPGRTLMTEALRNEETLNGIGTEQLAGLRGTAPTSEAAPAREQFDALFSEQFPDQELTGFEGSSFDATLLAFLAAVRAGSSDPAAIADNLQAVSGPPGDTYTFENLDQAVQALAAGEDVDYEGAWGPIDFDDNGDPGSAIYEVWEFQDGTIETIDTFTFGGEGGSS